LISLFINSCVIDCTNSFINSAIVVISSYYHHVINRKLLNYTYLYTLVLSM